MKRFAVDAAWFLREIENQNISRQTGSMEAKKQDK